MVQRAGGHRRPGRLRRSFSCSGEQGGEGRDHFAAAELSVLEALDQDADRICHVAASP
jgi:hypothetical protein